MPGHAVVNLDEEFSGASASQNMLSAENTIQQISCMDAPVKQDALPAGGIRIINLDKSQEDCEQESNMTKTSGS